MPAAKLNFTLEQGATFTHSLVRRDGLDIYSPVKDLTGYSARIHLRSDVSSTDVLLELNTTNGRIVITPATGSIELKLSAEETALLDFTKAVYDMEVRSPSGIVTRIVQGAFSLSKRVTR